MMEWWTCKGKDLSLLFSQSALAPALINVLWCLSSSSSAARSDGNTSNERVSMQCWANTGDYRCSSYGVLLQYCIATTGALYRTLR